MDIKDLDTQQKTTWCPGCFNNLILLSVKEALAALIKKGTLKQEEVAAVSGIGCHGKIAEALKVNSFHTLHGRVLPTMLGLKMARPDLTVLGFGGDGDTYAEGTAHFIHAPHYNFNATMVVHDNQVFALTTGQSTPTSEASFAGAATPLGRGETTLNPIALALENGATFVARGLALEPDKLTRIFQEAILHKGFSFVDVLQPCLVYHNNQDFLRKNSYSLEKEGHNKKSLDQALQKAGEWNYSAKEDVKIPVGIFFQKKAPVFSKKWPHYKK